MVRAEKQELLEITLELARKFGFVSRSVIWRYLGSKSTATKYRYWRFLTKRPEFTLYSEGVQSRQHLVVSAGYRRALGDGSCARTRAAIYFEHDNYLMNFFLLLKHREVLLGCWTEQQLKMDHLLALEVLGSVSEAKLPDLVLSLKTESTPLRVAVEIERTQKSQHRYQIIQLAYRRTSKIDLLLFGVSDEKTEVAIRKAFDGEMPSNLFVGYFSLNDFKKASFEAELRVRQRKRSLEKFLAQICGTNWRSESLENELK